MRPVLPADPPLVDELEVGLVHERGGGKRLSAAIAPQMPSGEAPQLAVDGIHQGGHGRLVAVTPRKQQTRDVAWLAHVLGPAEFYAECAQ